MHLVITEKQLRDIVKRRFPDQEISEQGEDAAAAAPEAGTSSDGETKTGMPKWESGVTRGPANQIAVTRWKDIAGVTPARGKANPLWEQVLGPTAAAAGAQLNQALNPATDTPYKEYTTFWGEKYKIPTDGSVHLGFWDDQKPRASRFSDSHEISGVWYWDQKYTNPKTKKIEVVEELAPDEESLSTMFPTNTLRGIYVVKEDKWFGVIAHKDGEQWVPYNGYFYNPGNNQKAIAYKPELYIHTSLTTSFITWVKENWTLIAEVIVSIAAGILTGGASLMVQALVQAGVSAAFAIGVYAFSDKNAEDKMGLATGLAIAALPFIPAAINKFGLKGPLSGLAKYGDDLAKATSQDEIATIISKFPEAEQVIIKSAFKEIPKHEFEKVIANKAARGFAAQVRAGKIDLGKLPAYRLKFWQELLIEGGGAIPVTFGVGYVFKTIEERKAAEKQTKILSDGFESKKNIEAIDKLSADAENAKKLNTNAQSSNSIKPVTQINKQTEPTTNKEVPKKTIGLFGPTTPVVANDSTAIK